jgi:hypothetical protein
VKTRIIAALLVSFGIVASVLLLNEQGREKLPTRPVRDSLALVHAIEKYRPCLPAPGSSDNSGCKDSLSGLKQKTGDTPVIQSVIIPQKDRAMVTGPTIGKFYSVDPFVAGVHPVTGQVTLIYPGEVFICAAKPFGCGYVKVIKKNKTLTYALR